MGTTTVPLEATLRTDFQFYPKTLTQLELLQADYAASLVEGAARLLQLIVVRSVEGEFLLTERVMLTGLSRRRKP